ncbi:hypothetical protein NPIL_536381, partial [Nephila pilipes]
IIKFVGLLNVLFIG